MRSFAAHVTDWHQRTQRTRKPVPVSRNPTPRTKLTVQPSVVAFARSEPLQNRSAGDDGNAIGPTDGPLTLESTSVCNSPIDGIRQPVPSSTSVLQYAIPFAKL